MKINRSIFLAGMLSLPVLAALAGCGPAETSQTLPGVATPTTQVSALPSTTPVPAATAPAAAQVQLEAIEIEMADLVNEYTSDPAGAAARYGGKLLLVRNVVIEDMSEVHKPPSPEQFISNQGFRFRTDYLELMMPLKVGYTVDVEGIFAGPVLGYILVSHCTFTITDDSFGYSRPDYQFTFS